MLLYHQYIAKINNDSIKRTDRWKRNHQNIQNKIKNENFKSCVNNKNLNKKNNYSSRGNISIIKNIYNKNFHHRIIKMILRVCQKLDKWE